MKIDPDQDEITFYVYADSFYCAAVELERSTNPAKVSTAFYFLYGHSLELSLKSYLYSKGFNIKQLKNIGHNLETALEKCINTGFEALITVDSDYLKTVKMINKYYSTKEFEYMVRTEKTFPSLIDGQIQPRSA
jgi:hypothetical protein